MSLVANLVYGCGRLTGGASARGAQALLAQVLDAGVTALDVAPLYGMGTAEEVVGEALARWSGPRIAVTTKAGLGAPALPYLRTVLRSAKRRLSPPRPATPTDWQPSPPQAAYGEGDYAPQALAASVERSARRLPHIDRLMLHAAGPQECTPEVAAALDALARQHGARPGYAVQGWFDAGLHAAYPRGFAAEAAVPPALLTGDAVPDIPEGTMLHSLVRTAQWCAARDPRFAAELDRRAEALAGCDPAAARIAAAFATAHERAPGALLVFSSTDAGRLATLLAAFAAVDRAR